MLQIRAIFSPYIHGQEKTSQTTDCCDKEKARAFLQGRWWLYVADLNKNSTMSFADPISLLCIPTYWTQQVEVHSPTDFGQVKIMVNEHNNNNNHNQTKPQTVLSSARLIIQGTLSPGFATVALYVVPLCGSGQVQLFIVNDRGPWQRHREREKGKCAGLGWRTLLIWDEIVYGT